MLSVYKFTLIQSVCDQVSKNAITFHCGFVVLVPLPSLGWSTVWFPFSVIDVHENENYGSLTFLYVPITVFDSITR